MYSSLLSKKGDCLLTSRWGPWGYKKRVKFRSTSYCFERSSSTSITYFRIQIPNKMFSQLLLLVAIVVALLATAEAWFGYGYGYPYFGGYGLGYGLGWGGYGFGGYGLYGGWWGR